MPFYRPANNVNGGSTSITWDQIQNKVSLELFNGSVEFTDNGEGDGVAIITPSSLLEENKYYEITVGEETVITQYIGNPVEYSSREIGIETETDLYVKLYGTASATMNVVINELYDEKIMNMSLPLNFASVWSDDNIVLKDLYFINSNGAYYKLDINSSGQVRVTQISV